MPPVRTMACSIYQSSSFLFSRKLRYLAACALAFPERPFLQLGGVQQMGRTSSSMTAYRRLAIAGNTYPGSGSPTPQRRTL
jgi:hypothetical protein